MPVAPKLSADDVRAIRRWYAKWKTVQRPSVVARQYGLNHERLKAIGEGLAYKWVAP